MCEDDVSIQWYECEIFYFELIIYIKIERLPLSPPKINSFKKNACSKFVGKLFRIVV